VWRYIEEIWVANTSELRQLIGGGVVPRHGAPEVVARDAKEFLCIIPLE
jgi:hypothetical protein